MSKKVRVLSPLPFEGQTYQPDQVVEFDDKIVKAFEKDGVVDTSPDAVSYCLDQLGAKVQKHCMTEEEAARVETAAAVLAAETAEQPAQ
jgi:hypothetical protein